MSAISASPCASGTSSPPPSGFLAGVYRALDADWQSERDLTARVATLAALEFTEAQIVERLDVSAIKVRNALIRLRRLAPQLIREEL